MVIVIQVNGDMMLYGVKVSSILRTEINMKVTLLMASLMVKE